MSAEIEWVIARRVCTPAEIEVLLMRERLAIEGRDHGYRSVAEALEDRDGKPLSWSTVRDRIKRAEARIRRMRGAA